MGILVAISCVIILTTLWIFWRKKRMSILERYGIPGPKPNFWIGNLNDFNTKRQDCAMEWKELYGKCFGFYLGAKPMIVVCDVEMLRMIEVKEFKNFVNRDPILADAGIGHPVIQESTLAIRDQKWKMLRTVLNPAFTSGKIKKMMPTIDSATELFLKKISEKEKKSFNVVPLLKNLSFDIFGKILFGIDANVQNNDSSKVIASIYRFFDTDTTDITAFLSVCFPELEPLPCMMRSAIDIIRYYLEKPCFRIIVDACKHIIKRRKFYPEERKPDMLQNMIDANSVYEPESTEDQNPDIKRIAKKITLPDSTVIGNAMGFMTVGYEATSLVLGYFIYHLAANPHIQDRVREEIVTSIGDKKDVTYEDLMSLQYLDQCFSEVLRMLPVSLSAVTRVTKEEFKFKDVTIPKGVTVIVPICLLNKDPDYWPEPTKFNPERFSPENKANIDPICYQPFGAGPRICIGVRFAHVVIKQILVSILKRYRLERTDDCKELELESSILVVKPKNGIDICAISI